LDFFLKGLLIGLSIAAPVGPIGVLCIRRSLADGPRTGLVVGLGAATADATYGCIAAFGLTAISSFLIGQQFWLGLFGGLFLCWLGYRTFITPPATNAADAKGENLLTIWFSTLLLTLTNPATILSFAAVFAGLGLGATPDYLSASIMVLGVFIGSALWWLFLSNLVALFRSRITPQWMKNVNRFSGCTLIAFGAYALIRALRPS
jgi:threonine/homoserine/homoserine lactone efflux protein